MNEVKVNITVFDKNYPLYVQASEEENTRKAAKILTQNISELKEKYGITEKFDLLSMAAISIASQLITIKSELDNSNNTNIEDKLKNIEERLDFYLAQE